MTLRFRQSFRLFPGVRLNVGKRGVSASFGVPGATINVGRLGVRGTVGLPGTGVSYSAMLSAPKAAEKPSVWEPPKGLPLDHQVFPTPDGRMREIGSAAVEHLTSAGLTHLRQMIVDARQQRGEIEADLRDARQEYSAREGELKRKKNSWFRAFFKKRIASLEEMVPVLEAEVDRLEAWLDATHIEIEFETHKNVQRAYGGVVRAFDELKQSAVIWDVTADRQTDRVAERTTASRTVERRQVTVDYNSTDLVRFAGQALRFKNANGDDILIYPGMILMPRPDGAFALLDLREVEVGWEGVQFIEPEQVPSDAQVVGHTWAKANKDGSPDRRFNGNYQIPVCLYGRIGFASKTGLLEEYQCSNVSAALAFGRALDDYKSAIANVG